MFAFVNLSWYHMIDFLENVLKTPPGLKTNEDTNL